MLFPQIRCFHSSVNEQPFMFFILSKGENAGMPRLVPWANCFAVRCNNKEAFEYYYWLVYALFKAGKFKTRQRGSVIQFINIQDVRDIIRQSLPLVFEQWQKYQRLLQHLDALEKAKTTLGMQLVTTENLQRTLLHKFFQ